MPPVPVLTPYTFVSTGLFTVLTGSFLAYQIGLKTEETGDNVLVLSILIGWGVIMTGDLPESDSVHFHLPHTILRVLAERGRHCASPPPTHHFASVSWPRVTLCILTPHTPFCECYLKMSIICTV